MTAFLPRSTWYRAPRVAALMRLTDEAIRAQERAYYRAWLVDKDREPAHSSAYIAPKSLRRYARKPEPTG